MTFIVFFLLYKSALHEIVVIEARHRQAPNHPRLYAFVANSDDKEQCGALPVQLEGMVLSALKRHGTQIAQANRFEVC